MTESKPLTIKSEILVRSGELEVNGEYVRKIRLYDDGCWELLNEDELPIQQGYVEKPVSLD